MPIRMATAHDAAAIAKVHVESWRTTYKGIVPDDFLAHLSYARREQFWRQVLTEPGSRTIVYVAEDAQGTVIGFASGGPERSGDPVYTGELYAIYLLAQHQGLGIGRQLVMPLAHHLWQGGMGGLLLWVLAANPARKSSMNDLEGNPWKKRLSPLAVWRSWKLPMGGGMSRRSSSRKSDSTPLGTATQANKARRHQLIRTGEETGDSTV